MMASSQKILTQSLPTNAYHTAVSNAPYQLAGEQFPSNYSSTPQNSHGTQRNELSDHSTAAIQRSSLSPPLSATKDSENEYEHWFIDPNRQFCFIQYLVPESFNCPSSPTSIRDFLDTHSQFECKTVQSEAPPHASHQRSFETWYMVEDIISIPKGTPESECNRWCSEGTILDINSEGLLHGVGCGVLAGSGFDSSKDEWLGFDAFLGNPYMPGYSSISNGLNTSSGSPWTSQTVIHHSSVGKPAGSAGRGRTEHGQYSVVGMPSVAVHGPTTPTKQTEFQTYGCQKCSKILRRQNDLRRHMNEVHGIGIRRFKCPDCKEKFKRRAHLHAHQTRKRKCTAQNTARNAGVENAYSDNERSASY